MAKRAFAPLHIVCQLYPFLDQRALVTYIHILVTIWSIVTCYPWGCIKKHPEASVGSKYSSPQDFGQMCTHVTTFGGAALLAYLLPGAIQSAGYHL